MKAPSELPRALFVADDVSELLVFRRLLRDTSYVVETVRSAGQALERLEQRDYAAVITDDERLSDLSGIELLRQVERLRPTALRILLVASERTLGPGVADGLCQAIVRPFIAKPLLAALTAHEQSLRAAARRAEPVRDTSDETMPSAPPAGIEAAASPEREPTGDRLRERRLLLTMAELAEAKAGYSSGHAARVSALAVILGRELGLSAAEVTTVEDAAIVHDVGELVVDPLILALSRKLDPHEEDAVRAHVAVSHRVARRAGLSEEVLEAILHHHERFDGAGHPSGLAGEAIPIGSRVIAVADTWDALATDRPYRRAVPLSECVQMFGELAGTQLDRELVTLFLDRRLHELIDWTEPPRPGSKLI
jgi:HD-GYP domain-containing protein (c-di-GMP phosphodiesterase class II)